MNNKRVDKRTISSEKDEYDRDYFIRLLLIFVIFSIMHIFSK